LILFANGIEKIHTMKKLNKLGVENSLWNNIRAKAGSGNKPTKEMLKQEKKIKSKEKKK